MAQYQRLCLAEREEIYRYLREGCSRREIARRLDRSDRTILDELKRCEGDPLGYLPDRAQAHADAQASERRAPSGDLREAQLEHVHARLKEGYSPEQIAGRLKREGSELYLCHESIYRLVYSTQGKARGLPALLPKRHKKRIQRKAQKPRAGGIKEAVSIHERPEEVNHREVFGHWEGDGVIFKRVYAPSVTTLVERVSRLAILRYNDNRTTDVVVPDIIDAMKNLPPEARRSLTVDRGSEFAAHTQINQQLSMPTFFCDPRSPWQKGANENFNGRLRRYLPKGKIPPNLCQEKLDELAKRMNNIPRKCLNYQTPNEVFNILTQQHALPNRCVRS